jgi:GxxExxY protein
MQSLRGRSLPFSVSKIFASPMNHKIKSDPISVPGSSAEKSYQAKDAKEINMEENAIGNIVVDVAVQIHRDLGPGLLETVYEVVLAKELEQRGLKVERQVPVPIVYGGLRFEEGFRADMIVHGKVILELKSVEQLSKVHAKQLLTYLKLKGAETRLCLNFGGNLMKRWHRTHRERTF